MIYKPHELIEHLQYGNRKISANDMMDSLLHYLDKINVDQDALIDIDRLTIPSHDISIEPLEAIVDKLNACTDLTELPALVTQLTDQINNLDREISSFESDCEQQLEEIQEQLK